MLTALLIAAAGALAVQLLPLLSMWQVAPDERPNFKEVVYWLPFLVHPMIAVLLVWVYYSSELVTQPVAALHIGISAPLIIRSLSNAAPPTVESSSID